MRIDMLLRHDRVLWTRPCLGVSILTLVLALHACAKDEASPWDTEEAGNSADGEFGCPPDVATAGSDADGLDQAELPDATEETAIPCPTGRGELEQSEAEKMNGKPCDSTVDECGHYWPCQCSAWCHCHAGAWDCDWVCDDSCFEDASFR